MNTKITNTPSAEQTTTVETLTALAGISLDSAERLSELTLATARKSVEDFASAASAAVRTGGAQDASAVQSAYGPAMFESAISYAREAYEIVAQAQAEAAKLAGRAFPASFTRFPGAEGMNDVLGMFTGGFQRLSAMTTQNLESATEAGSRLVRRADASEKKVA